DGGVCFMKKRVEYPVEVKWKAIKMKENGYTNREIMEELGIKNKSQIKTWMKWHREGQTYRFEQPVGKHYALEKGPKHLSEIQRKDAKIRHLEAEIAVLEKYMKIERG